MATIGMSEGDASQSPVDQRQPDKREPECQWGDEDLDYVTLAKSGGRKDLLRHMEYVRVTDKPESYPVVEWFAHPTPPPPDSNSEPYESPLHKSWMTWKIVEQEKVIKLPQLHRKAVPLSKARRSHPPTHTKPPPLYDDHVQFDRLLSMDYQREWLKNRETKELQELRKAKEKRKARKQKLLEHTMKARRVAGFMEDGQSSKQRFIMKRFASVPAKLKLPTT